MSKILEAFRKFKHDMHEVENANKLKNILPCTTVYDMEHQFAFKAKKDNPTEIFNKTLMKVPYIYHTACNSSAYTGTNAQNQLLLHGMLFKALFDMYIKHCKKAFDNVLLANSQNKETLDRDMIDFFEYNNLPKRFRGIFVKYDADNYMLNVPHSQMIIAYNKKNKKALEKLLLRAKMLIPVIYKTVGPDINLGGLQIFEQDPSKPAFVQDSPSARCVNDEQLQTVCELHDIFVEIAKITLPIATKQRENSGAFEIEAEYEKEFYQQDVFARALEDLKNDHDAIEEQKKQLDTKHKKYRSDWFNILKSESCVRIK